MEIEDPREHKREIEDDQHNTYDREKETKTENEEKDSDYHYTDWASI